MDRTFWQQQTSDKPLFPDLLWSRPENRRHAGKLLVIGGNAHGFAAPAMAYVESIKAGVGLTRVLLPDAVKTVAKHALETVSFAPSTPSGSFSRQALAEILEQADWADGVLLAGDLGRNSETAIVLESFMQKYHGQITLTKDAADYLDSNAAEALARPQTTLVISLSQLQKLAKAAKYPEAVTFSMDLLHLVDWLHEFTTLYPVNLVTKHLENIFVAVNGQVSSSKLANDKDIWRVDAAAHVAVWWLQNTDKPFEALTTAVYY